MRFACQVQRQVDDEVRSRQRQTLGQQQRPDRVAENECDG